MADPSYPYSGVDLLTFLQTFNPPAWCFDREVPCIGNTELIGKEIEEMKAPTSIPNYTKKCLAMLSVSHLPSLASVEPARLLGAHHTEFLDPTSKKSTYKCQGSVFSWD